jgi:nitrate reductase cytochrome c-type subunit
MVTFNSTRTSERSLLLAGQQQFLIENSYQQTASSVKATLTNSTSITNTLMGQLYQVRQMRYEPYQPYMPPVIPQSVIDLQMSTINVGVPHSFFTCADGKGVQFVTT